MTLLPEDRDLVDRLLARGDALSELAARHICHILATMEEKDPMPDRTKLSELNEKLAPAGLTLTRFRPLGGWLALKNVNGDIEATVEARELFDSNGHNFEDDLP
jgi:hypothetical protein